MRIWLPALLIASLTARVAMADCRSVPECLQHAGIGAIDPKVAAAAAVAAASILTMGAYVTATKLDEVRPPPPGVVQGRDEQGRPRRTLALIPTPEPPAPSTERPAHSAGVVQFNDTLANVGLAVGGAALLGTVIAGMLSHH